MSQHHLSRRGRTLSRPGAGSLVGLILAAGIACASPLTTTTKDDTDRADHADTVSVVTTP